MAIDHNIHNVFYLGAEERLKDIPFGLKCSKIICGKENNTIDCALQFVKNNAVTFDRVVSLSEYEVMEAAQIREMLNISGQKPNEVIKVRDKVLMKEILKNAGILVPTFFELKDIIDNQEVLKYSFSDRVVVKPKDGAASSNVLTFANISQFLNLLESKSTGIKELDDENQVSNYEVESFISGDIYHIDGIMDNGKIALLQVSKYINNCLDYARGRPLGSVQVVNKDIYKDFTAKVVKALNIMDSSFHLEIIQNSRNEIYFLEIANRPGGGDVGKVFELKTGVHLQRASVLSMIGKPILVPSETDKEVFFGFFLFPGHKLKCPKIDILDREVILQDKTLLSYNINNAKNLSNNLSYRSSDLPFSGIVKGTTAAMKEYLELLFKNTTLSEKL